MKFNVGIFLFFVFALFAFFGFAAQQEELEEVVYLPLIRADVGVDSPSTIPSTTPPTIPAVGTPTVAPPVPASPTISPTSTRESSTAEPPTPGVIPSVTAAPTNTAMPSPTWTPTSTSIPAPTSTSIPASDPPVIERPALPAQESAAGNSPQIEIANGGGVSGYTVALFGSGFGYPQGSGSVSILGQAAEVIEWTDRYIQLVVPPGPAGSGNLTVETAVGQSASWPFERYDIDPQFLNPPQTRFINIAYQRPVTLQNFESEFCYAQPDNDWTLASQFLTDFRCGYANLTNVGSAHFGADSSLGKTAVLAFEVEEAMVGDHYFQFFAESSWYSSQPDTGADSYPHHYTLEVSNNSTDGLNGDWLVLETVAGNVKGIGLHPIQVPSGGYTWFRMRVTDGTNDTTDVAGKDFKMKEIRLYRPVGGGDPIDSFVIYGDSITADAFATIGFHGLSNRLKQGRGDTYDPIVTTLGLSGQNSGGLLDEETDFDIYDALDRYGYDDTTVYWGIALGTNDSGDGASGIGVPWSNLEQFDDRLDEAVTMLIARGKVPIIARIPDTDEGQGGFGDIVSKQKILADIDQIAAEYRLIPGPDLYTEFRRNILFHDSDYLREGDGTHHSNKGIPVLVDMWRQTFESIEP